MRDKFQFTITNERIVRYEFVRLILLTLNLVGISYLMVFYQMSMRLTLFHLLGIISVFISFSNVLMGHYGKARRRHDVIFWITLLLCSASWLTHDGFPFWAGIAMIGFAILDMLAFKSLNVVFTPDYVQVPSLLNKKFSWKEIDNVILKDDIITIDFKNNKIVQEKIIPPDYELAETEFQQFCREQVIKSLLIPDLN